MDLENFVKTLASHQQHKPFRQYDIELSSGTIFRVKHPDCLAFMGPRALVVTADGRMHEFNNESVQQLTQTDIPAEKDGPAIKPTT